MHFSYWPLNVCFSLLLLLFKPSWTSFPERDQNQQSRAKDCMICRLVCVCPDLEICCISKHSPIRLNQRSHVHEMRQGHHPVSSADFLKKKELGRACCAHVFVCECVCVWKRENSKERAPFLHLHSFHCIGHKYENELRQPNAGEWTTWVMKERDTSSCYSEQAACSFPLCVCVCVRGLFLSNNSSVALQEFFLHFSIQVQEFNKNTSLHTSSMHVQ